MRPIALKNRWSGRLNFFVTRVIGLSREVGEDRGEFRSGLESSSQLDFDNQNGAADYGRKINKLLQINRLRSLSRARRMVVLLQISLRGPFQIAEARMDDPTHPSTEQGVSLAVIRSGVREAKNCSFDPARTHRAEPSIQLLNHRNLRQS